MKELLVVINTLGRAGAETALLELLRHLDPSIYKVSLYVVAGQGELVKELPSHVRLLNRHYNDCSVLSKEGKKYLSRQVLRAMAVRGTLLRCLPYLCVNLWDMVKKGRILPDKLLWRVLSDGGQRIESRFDLAVAFIEGGAAYYVADHVKAKKKAAFIHIDYGSAGYTRALDKNCYQKFDKIFAVSDEVKTAFLQSYPECAGKLEVFHNLVDPQRVRAMSRQKGGFSDQFAGQRILTVGRLTAQKGLELSVEAMALLKKAGLPVRWYVLGEGSLRGYLEEYIRERGLSEDFVLLGAVSNPYPYIRQADLYVQTSRYEGKSIAIQEAQILEKAVLVSDCSGNREQVTPDVDGMICKLSPEAICGKIRLLLSDKELRKRLGAAAAQKKTGNPSELDKLLALL